MGIGLILSPKSSLRRYWSADSERYAPASALLYFLDIGWRILDVEVSTVFYSSGRNSTLYHFLLTRGGETLQMPVLSSPAIARLLERKAWIVTERLASSPQMATFTPRR